MKGKRRLKTCDCISVAQHVVHVIYSVIIRVYFGSIIPIIYYIYPSNTSKLHIRKYIQWLHDNDYVPLADIVRHMYNLGIKYKKSFVVYNLSADNYEAVDDYRYFVK